MAKSVFPTREELNRIRSFGFTPKSTKNKTGKQQIIFLGVNTEASTYGVIIPEKKKEKE